MAFRSPSNRRGSRPVTSASTHAESRSRLDRDLEDLRKRELELRKLEEKMKQRVEDLPKEVAEKARRQEEMIKLRAIATATYADGLSRPRDKRHSPSTSSTGSRRMTKPEERSARLQFLLLCAVLAMIMVLLWKSLP